MVGELRFEMGGMAHRFFTRHDRAIHDLPRSLRVGFHVGGGNGEARPDAVEAMALLIGGKFDGGIEVDIEQVFHRVGVFGAVQAAEDDLPAGTVAGGFRCPDTIGDPAGEGGDLVLSGRSSSSGGMSPKFT